MKRIDWLALACAVSALLVLPQPVGGNGEAGGLARVALGALAVLALGVAAVRNRAGVWLLASTILAALALACAVLLVGLLRQGLEYRAGPGYFWALVAVWLAAWHTVDALVQAAPATRSRRTLANIAIPFVFGLAVLFLWETGVRGFGNPMMKVILPAPSAIGARFASSLPILGADFLQTARGMLVGYVMGCGSGILVAMLIDRVPFLQRGLLPLGNLVSALPIVGVAPIMVMWFGFDWQSKAAIVVIMTFFPQLVNTVAGLGSAGAMERDLMKTYAATYGQTLWNLRLPAALPFIFNGLKINTTLALIGAIVAEFFGTPIVGMGFRINTEVGRMNIDMVWATILVAAITGSLFYGILALLERRATFWHASYRVRAA